MSRRTQALRTAQLSFGTTLALEEASRERLAQAARDNATAPAPSPHMESILAIYAAVEVNQEIPGEHYKAVAEIISYVWKLRPSRHGSARPS